MTMTAEPVEARRERNTQILKLYQSGLAIHDIAAVVGLSPAHTHRLLQRAGVTRPRGGPRGNHRLQPGQLTPEQLREYEQRLRDWKPRR